VTKGTLRQIDPSTRREGGDRGGQGRETAQSLRRAIALLRALARRNEHGARLSDLAQDAGLHVATAHRLLSVLVDEGLATHNPYSKAYNLGIEVFSLGQAAQRFAIRDRLHGLVADLARQTGDVALLSIRSGYDSICIDKAEGGHAVPGLTLAVGARRPLGLPAGSLALLAFGHEAEIDAIVAANAERYADYNGLTAAEIRERIAAARELGFALNDGRVRPDVRAVSVPVRNRRGEVVAALTVAGTPDRLDRRRMTDIAALVLARTAPLAPALE
jgi:DNA-binding IclR family transcriptional regulator